MYFQIILVSRLVIDRILSKLSEIETKIDTMMEEQKHIIEQLENKEKDLLPVSGYTKFNLTKDFDHNFCKFYDPVNLRRITAIIITHIFIIFINLYRRKL